MAKTLVDLDEAKIAAVGEQLGTKTKKDTLNAAMDFVLASKDRVRDLIEDGIAAKLGVGTDVTDPEIMKGARR